MPVEIVAHTTGGDVRVVVQNNQRDQNFYFIVPNQPTSVEVDPDIHILRYDPIQNAGGCTATGVDDPLPIRTDIVSVFPNPASRTFSVQYSSGSEGNIDLGVYDVAGRRVLTKTITRTSAGAGAEFFDASALPGGVYFVRMRPPHGDVVTRKLVVVR